MDSRSARGLFRFRGKCGAHHHTKRPTPQLLSYEPDPVVLRVTLLVIVTASQQAVMCRVQHFDLSTPSRAYRILAPFTAGIAHIQCKTTQGFIVNFLDPYITRATLATQMKREEKISSRNMHAWLQPGALTYFYAVVT